MKAHLGDEQPAAWPEDAMCLDDIIDCSHKQSLGHNVQSKVQKKMAFMLQFAARTVIHAHQREREDRRVSLHVEKTSNLSEPVQIPL